ncbi:MAG: BspA family leucine-rich repeat surface protein [Bacilli bacterium]|nr:BspA family leucine-rich repeat surface protein [Bacilli bacterium]
MKRVFSLYNICLVLILGLISVLTLTTTEVKAVGNVIWPNGQTAPIERTVQNVYNAPEVTFYYDIIDPNGTSAAMFDEGPIVNSKIKSLANNTSCSVSYHDYTVTQFSRANHLPDGFVPTEANTISADGYVPIYIFSEASGTVSYYTEAETIYLNAQAQSMFSEFVVLQYITGGQEWDASLVYDIGGFFSHCQALMDISFVTNWDVSNVHSMNYTFCALTSIADNRYSALSNWDTSNVVSMEYTFYASNIYSNESIANWNTCNVISMKGMFRECTNLQGFTAASSWDTRNVTDISYMLYGCVRCGGVFQILGRPTSYDGAFYNTDITNNVYGNSWLTINYNCSVTNNINAIMATKSGNSRIQLGSCVQPSGTCPNPAYIDHDTRDGASIAEVPLTFDGSDTVSNTYTVSGLFNLDLNSLTRLKMPITDVGTYTLKVKEVGTATDLYPVDEDNEYTIVIQAENILDNNDRPTGDYNATFVIMDDNDTKKQKMAFAEPKDESRFGHIELTKTIKGIMSDPTKYFDFSIQVDDRPTYTCTDYSGSEKYPISGVDSGHYSAAEVTKCKSGTKDTISLKHGQTATIGQFTYNNNNYDAISTDDYYKIIEGTESDYTTTFKINNGSATSGSDTGLNSISNSGNVVTFYNQKEGSPVTGIILTILPYLILIGIGIGGVLLYRKIGANKRTV